MTKQTEQRATQMVGRRRDGYESPPLDDPFSAELDALIEGRQGEGGVEAA